MAKMTRAEAERILGFKPDERYDFDEVRRRFRQRAKKMHPDAVAAHGGDTDEATRAMQQINEAYALLSALTERGAIFVACETGSAWDGGGIQEPDAGFDSDLDEILERYRKQAQAYHRSGGAQQAGETDRPGESAGGGAWDAEASEAAHRDMSRSEAAWRAKEKKKDFWRKLRSIARRIPFRLLVFAGAIGYLLFSSVRYRQTGDYGNVPFLFGFMLFASVNLFTGFTKVLNRLLVALVDMLEARSR